MIALIARNCSLNYSYFLLTNLKTWFMKNIRCRVTFAEEVKNFYNPTNLTRKKATSASLSQ